MVMEGQEGGRGSRYGYVIYTTRNGDEITASIDLFTGVLGPVDPRPPQEPGN